jgi:hypothetical protein
VPLSLRPRAIAEISDSVLRQIDCYALAAGAAGVGLLALAPPAESQIVYTPAHSLILTNSCLSFDLKHDGTADFVIQNGYEASASFASGSLVAAGVGAKQDSRRQRIWL